jgi:hypothetical protein
MRCPYCAAFGYTNNMIPDNSFHVDSFGTLLVWFCCNGKPYTKHALLQYCSIRKTYQTKFYKMAMFFEMNGYKVTKERAFVEGGNVKLIYTMTPTEYANF